MAGELSLEILRHAPKWQKYLDALAASYPGPSRVVNEYEGKGDILLMWGPGGAHQWPAFGQHRTSGRPVIALDMGYWRRTVEHGAHRYVRVTVNRQHPRNMPPCPPDRFNELKVTLAERSDHADGPIIVIGLGGKSRQQLCLGGITWERQAYSRIRAAFPKKRIVYRPKGKQHERLYDCHTDTRTDIADVIRGASLVVGRHSNVMAVDCVQLGIPAVCDDGAGADIWPSELRITRPTMAQRLDYCHRLAYWQYNLIEMREGKAWPFLLDRIHDTGH